ncbi:MAG TPA: hypothetical protein VLS89_06215 [Candidatus Nanopelagicales bacterium]|nr:hypothetical protein [Candidatus Nanopelagicales bacterium]
MLKFGFKIGNWDRIELNFGGNVGRSGWKFIGSAGVETSMGAGEFFGLGAAGGYFLVESEKHEQDDYRCWFTTGMATVGAGLINTPISVSIAPESFRSGQFDNFYRTPWAPNASGEAGHPTGFLTRCLFVAISQSFFQPDPTTDPETLLQMGSSITLMFLGGPEYNDPAALILQPQFYAYNPWVYKYVGLVWGASLTIPYGVGAAVYAGGVTAIRNLTTGLRIGRDGQEYFD